MTQEDKMKFKPYSKYSYEYTFSDNLPMGDMFEELQKQYPGDTIFSWGGQYALLWDWLVSADLVDMTYPPALKIMNGSLEKSGSEYLLGTCSNYWVSTTDASGNPVSVPIDHHIKLYPKAINREIKTIAGKTPTPTALLIIVSVTILHELGHHLNVCDLWKKCYDSNDPDPYLESYKKLVAGIDSMGSDVDEKKADEFAVKILKKWLFGHRFLDVKLTGPYVEFIKKTKPATIDAIDVARFYEIQCMRDHDDLSPDIERILLEEQFDIMARLHKSGKKNGKPYHFTK